jgi:hypothetical protein
VAECSIAAQYRRAKTPHFEKSAGWAEYYTTAAPPIIAICSAAAGQRTNDGRLGAHIKHAAFSILIVTSLGRAQTGAQGLNCCDLEDSLGRRRAPGQTGLCGQSLIRLVPEQGPQEVPRP